MNESKPVAVLSEDGKWLTVVGPQFGVSHTFELVYHFAGLQRCNHSQVGVT